jgi:hypothetical protein
MKKPDTLICPSCGKNNPNFYTRCYYCNTSIVIRKKTSVTWIIVSSVLMIGSILPMLLILLLLAKEGISSLFGK